MGYLHLDWGDLVGVGVVSTLTSWGQVEVLVDLLLSPQVVLVDITLLKDLEDSEVVGVDSMVSGSIPAAVVLVVVAAHTTCILGDRWE